MLDGFLGRRWRMAWLKSEGIGVGLFGSISARIKEKMGFEIS